MKTLPIWEKKKSITMTVYWKTEMSEKKWHNTFQMLKKTVKTESYS